MKIPYAFRDGIIVHISDVEKGKKCDAYCPVCGEFLIARKGEVMSHHFAHYPDSDCYVGESFIHIVAKYKMKEYLEKTESVVVNWRCKFCSERFSGDLSPYISKIELETRKYDSFRPDIACYDINNRLYCLIEVVHTHQPGSNILRFCEDYHVPLLKIYAEEFLYNQVWFYVNHFCRSCYDNKRHINKLKPVEVYKG